MIVLPPPGPPTAMQLGMAASTSSAQALSFRRRTKQEICDAFILKLRERPELEIVEAEIRAHFDRLPTRYALDVNIER